MLLRAAAGHCIYLFITFLLCGADFMSVQIGVSYIFLEDTTGRGCEMWVG